MPKYFRAVCFDLDGVLMDTMPLHARAWQDALKPYGLRVSKRAIYEWEGEPGITTAGVMLRQRGGALSRQTIVSLLHAKERRFRFLAKRISVNRNLKRLISRLAERGVRIGLVTGTSAGEVRRVVPARVLAVFHIVVTGDQVHQGKPHPEPYRTALRRLGVPAARSIVVENAPYGIRSAREAHAGLVIALASSLPKSFLGQADVVVPSVSQLVTLLDRLTW